MAVQDTVAFQKQLATDSVAQADGFLSNLNDLADSSFFVVPNVPTIPSPGYGFNTTDDTVDLLTGFFPAAISVADISATAPTFTPTDVDTLPDVPVADFTKVAPDVEIPAAPSSALPTAPTAPSLTDPVLPTAPTITLPTAPTLGTITLPEPPSIEIPAFESTLPIDDLVTPTNTFEFAEVAYTSALLDSVQAKLLDNLENGGYGIETADESAMLDRSRTQELLALMDQQQQITADAAARGFPMPPGDMHVALQEAQGQFQRRVSAANRDITNRRADLYVDNRKFTITEVRSLETVLINYHNSVMERALNAAKATLDASIQIYNAQVARFNARIARYQAEGTVFEARVRAALARVEIFRVEMEGKKIEGDLQRVQVEVYNAQLKGVTTVVDLYTAQLNAAKIASDMELVRMQAFRALIDAYQAQVQAKVAEFQMFEARIKGEVAKVQAFESEAKAYVAAVEGAKTKADIAIARLRAQLEEARNAMEVYRAQADVYKADINAQSETIRARTTVYGAQVQGASAKAQAVAEAHRVTVTEKDLEFRRNVENARLAIEDAKILLQGLVASASSRVGAASAGAGYYSALTASAANALNTLTSLIATE